MSSQRKLEEVFKELETRFILNLGIEEISKPERLFFHLEQAWWFYEDQIADNHAHLPHYKFETFAREITQRTPLLQSQIHDFDEWYKVFKEYQYKIPVYGGALLTEDLSKVLLVTGFKQDSWGFPKGKINENEEELECAIREVFEETGFDSTYLKPKKEDHILWKHKTNGKQIKIFIIPGVPEDFPFLPRVVKEIGEMRWFNIDELPSADKDDLEAKKKEKFWGVSIFVPRLRRWIDKKLNRNNNNNNNVNNSPGLAPIVGGGDFPPEEMFSKSKILRERELLEEKQKKEEQSKNIDQSIFRIDTKKVHQAMLPFLKPF